MRILITGATSELGRLAAGHLIAAGHHVTGVAQAERRDLDPRVEAVYGPLDAPALVDLTDAADAVVHLAPVEPGVPESAGLTGVVLIANAAARSGTRLLVPVHAAGDPELYGQAEDLVTSSWGPTLVIRVAPLVGRLPDWAVCRTVATLLDTDHGRGGQVRLLHTDDLCRFLVHAVSAAGDGQVDLATTDPVTYVSARRLLAPVQARRRLPIWSVTDPVFSPDSLHRGWGFECGWGPSDAVADTAAALAGHRLDRDGVAAVRQRLPAPADVVIAPPPGQEPVPAGLAGEFDYKIDPRFPVFGTAGSSDALPGPLTPMTLDVQLAGLRCAQRATAAAMGLPAPLAAEWEARATAVFGHRVFTGVSIRRAVTPGLLTAKRLLGLSRYYGARCAAHAEAVAVAQRDGAALAACTAAQLDIRILMLRNQIQHGWTLTSVGVPIEGMINRLARRPHELIPQPAAMTSTAHLAAETAALAGWLRADRGLRDLAAAGDLTALRAASAGFGAAFDAAAQRVGHRGPGEAELANPVIADAPDQLLAAAALSARDNAAAAPERHRSDPVTRRADAARTARELAWDSTARATHQLRITMREKAIRLVAERILGAAEDVFYLTCDEVQAPPPDVRALVDRRQAERRRLQEMSLPEMFDGHWSPVQHAEDAATPEVAPIRG